MAATKKLTVLVVGAGPVGLSAALALAQGGVDLRIVDAGPTVDRRMRASTFHPPTLDMISTLGIADKLIARGLQATRFQLRQHEHEHHVTFDLNAIADATEHPYRLQVEQHHYCSIALEALAKLGISVEFDTCVDSVDGQSDSATVETGGERIRADWVIGADGASSTVRHSLGLEYAGKTYTHSSVLISTRFPFHEHLAGLSDVSYCWSRRGPFSLLRLKNLWRASLYPGFDSLEESAKETHVRDWLAYIHPDSRDTELLDVNPYRVHERCVDRFRVGRVLLAGDAAHLNPPSGGMGMNGGIHDAMNLSEKLLQVLAGKDDALLDQYHRQRHTLVSKSIIPLASANRARMATKDASIQIERLAEQAAIAADSASNRAFLLRASMISGLREAQTID